MQFIRQYMNLPKRVYIICGARIITAMGMFIFSFTSLILTSILGFSAVTSGYVLLISSLFGILGAFIFGHLADVLGRKKVLLTILAIGALNLFVGGFFCRTNIIIAVIILSNFIFSGVLPIIAAMVTDWSDDSNRTQCFSLIWLCINLGFSIGQVFAGQLFYNYYPWIFWGQGLGWLATIIIVALFIKDDFTPIGKIEKKEENSVPLISLVIKDKVLIFFMVTLVLATFAHMQLSFMIPLQFRDVLGLRSSSQLVSHMWMINGLCCALFTPFLNLLEDRLKPLKSMLLATIIYVIGFGVYSIATNYWLCLVMVPFWTCGEILINTTGGVFIASRSPEAYRARYQSLNGFATSLGNSTAPLVMSYFLMDHTYLEGWVLVSIICIIATILMTLVIKTCKKDPSQILVTEQ